MTCAYPTSIVGIPLSEHVPDLTGKDDILIMNEYLAQHPVNLHWPKTNYIMISLSNFDFTIIFSLFAVILTIGIYVGKTSGKNTNQYFLSGRNMPWWLLGLSMVATTFSTDTPNLVTDIVRTNGVSGNWVWWAFFGYWIINCFCVCKALAKVRGKY